MYGKCPDHPQASGRGELQGAANVQARKDFVLGLARGRFLAEASLSDWVYTQKPREQHFRRPWTRPTSSGVSSLCCVLDGRNRLLELKVKIIVVII